MDSVQQGLASRCHRPEPLVMHPSGIADVRSEHTVAHLHNVLLDALSHG